MADRRPKVLVVDDEPDLRELLSEALAEAGMDVTLAASGAEALDRVQRALPDILVADVNLGDCTGLEVLDRLRNEGRDVPTVVITGYKDAKTLTDAAHRRPADVLTKPLDLDLLTATIRGELTRQNTAQRTERRVRRLRRVAHRLNHQRKHAVRQLNTTCEDLTEAYQALSGQMALQQTVIAYQNKLLPAQNDDDVFSALFGTFARHSGAVFGVAMVCDAEAHLRIAGRFGVPQPDAPAFCGALVRPIVEDILAKPQCQLIDAGEEQDRFDAAIRRYLPGVTVLAVPLLPSAGELIGLVVFYRKGEQPFTDVDVALAELIAPSTAAAIRRND
ncbi:MAG: response regulator [Phycisphaerae bacterium]|nr:response regulator [Phycisphaerae bacterium]